MKTAEEAAAAMVAAQAAVAGGGLVEDLAEASVTARGGVVSVAARAAVAKEAEAAVVAKVAAKVVAKAAATGAMVVLQGMASGVAPLEVVEGAQAAAARMVAVVVK